MVFIDDASTDGTTEAAKQFAKSKGFDRITFLRRDKRKFATYNIYDAITNYCHKEDIVVSVDGDDELIGQYAFQLINSAYYRNK